MWWESGPIRETSRMFIHDAKHKNLIMVPFLMIIQLRKQPCTKINCKCWPQLSVWLVTSIIGINIKFYRYRRSNNIIRIEIEGLEAVALIRAHSEIATKGVQSLSPPPFPHKTTPLHACLVCGPAPYACHVSTTHASPAVHDIVLKSIQRLHCV